MFPSGWARLRGGKAMKFGKRLQAQSVPGWRQHYVDYKALKQHINAVAHIVPGTVRRPARHTPLPPS